MRVLPGIKRSSVAAALALLNVLALGNASADESAGHSPFGVLKREDFIGVAHPATAEHEALFSRPEDAPTDPWGAAVQPSTPAGDDALATPVLPSSQEIVTGSTTRLRPPSRPEKQSTEAWAPAAQSSLPATDVIFAAPIFPAAQEPVKGPSNAPLPPWRLEGATTDAWGADAPSSRPASTVVFAAPLLSVSQEMVTGWTDTPLPTARPEATTDAWSADAQSSRPADAVVFAAPVLPPGQEPVTGWTKTQVPPPRTEATTDAWDADAQSGRPADAVVFAAPVLPPGEGLVTGWTDTPLPPPRPEQATTDGLGAAAQASRPADEVVFAAPALPIGQEPVTAPSNTLLPSPLIEATVNAVVFGPPSGGAGPALMSDRLAGPLSVAVAPSGVTSVRALAPQEAVRLKALARGLLAKGSLAPARALLEDAASRGDAEGAYLLAQTYDPEALTRSGMIGVAGDAAKAEALYRAAQLGGFPRLDKNARAAQP